VVPKTLQWLISGNLPGTLFTENDPLPLADYYLPLMSLPFATGKVNPTELSGAPYLKVAVEAELPKVKTDKRQIGLVWTGSKTHERDHERSLLLDQFAPLFKIKDAQFYAPFTGPGLEEIVADTPVISLEKSIHDFADTATMLAPLDCLVTVDTAVAHLAGALGVKTYLLLQHSPDWRWGTSGETTPWYKSVTLLRQSRYGDWDSVIEGLVSRLA
jgi:ADP-heptose:LPS heptosyltransferase